MIPALPAAEIPFTAAQPVRRVGRQEMLGDEQNTRQ
jgi:hypothetical protein